MDDKTKVLTFKTSKNHCHWYFFESSACNRCTKLLHILILVLLKILQSVIEYYIIY